MKNNTNTTSELSLISHFFNIPQLYGGVLATCCSFENLTVILSWSLASPNLLMNRVHFSFSSGDNFPFILPLICCISLVKKGPSMSLFSNRCAK
jgi:hypothetical protein